MNTEASAMKHHGSLGRGQAANSSSSHLPAKSFLNTKHNEEKNGLQGGIRMRKNFSQFLTEELTTVGYHYPFVQVLEEKE